MLVGECFFNFYTITLYKVRINNDKIIDGVNLLDGMKSQSESNNQNTNNQNFENGDRSKDPLESLYSLLNELASEDEALAVNTTIFNGDTIENTSNNTDLSSADSTETPQLQHPPEAKIIDREVTPIESSVNRLPQLENDLTGDLSNITEPTEEHKQQIPQPSQVSLFDFDVTNEDNIEQISVSQQWIEDKEREINELAVTLNSLIPLVVELSKTDTNNSQEYILQAIVPVIDRVIQQRSSQDNQKMAAAIAHILPDAIRQEINNAPESIGKAIAPEIALSIKEQTVLHEGAIAKAMGSEMGKAIKTQIEMERDAMVDALYPVIGSTISKYMNEVVQSINEKVDNALSPVGIKRKIRAKIQGVSEAELIIKESLPYNVRAIFLIHKTSGLIIRELQPTVEEPLESDLLAGMLTAIRSFANDCIASDSELDEIDYDNFQILFETAGYCYLAVVVNGEPDRQFRDRMRTTFGNIIMLHGDVIEQYQGDPATIPESLQPLIEEIAYQGKKETASSPKSLYWLIGILLSSILIPWGIIEYRGSVAHRIEETVAIELDANPELSVYRLIPKVKKGQLTLTGRVPSNYLKSLAANVSNQIATAEDLTLDNRIVAVNVPPDPTVTTREIAQITAAINRSKTLINTDYQDGTVTINGLILNETERQNLITTFKNIPGVQNVVFITDGQLPALNTRIYFPSGASQLQLAVDSAKIVEIQQFLTQYPLIKLRIIGHSDSKGDAETNLRLAKARANSVERALVDRGIDPNRLEVFAYGEPPPQTPSQPMWLSRCVRFETFIEKN